MKNREAGFTLIEILLAFLFLSIAIVPIAYLLDSYYSKTNSSRLTGVATYLAEDVMEELSALSFDELSAVPPGATYTYATLGDFASITMMHQISKDSDFVHSSSPTPVNGHTGAGDASTSFKRIKVIVYWAGGQAGERVELVKVKGNY